MAPNSNGPTSVSLRRLVPGVVCLLVLVLSGCNFLPNNTEPSIEIISVPRAAPGGVLDLDRISGRVKGAGSGQRVILYARAGDWYVQPWADQPFTRIQADSTWSSETHLGTEYAALLVEPAYVPATLMVDLPATGGGVLAMTVVDGRPPFWRTWWFRLSLALLGLGVLFALYQWRLHHLRMQLTMRFEERLAERTRI